MTGSMERCIEETGRRRQIQMAHNEEHGITPRTVQKSADQVRFITRVADARTERPRERGAKVAEPAGGYDVVDVEAMIRLLEEQMRDAAKALDFETAAQLRDQLFELRARGTAPRSGGADRAPAVAAADRSGRAAGGRGRR
jgi:excinuclease ABC subunit B